MRAGSNFERGLGGPKSTLGDRGRATQPARSHLCKVTFNCGPCEARGGIWISAMDAAERDEVRGIR
jgi:hypothetical protein